MATADRSTIFHETASVLSHEAFLGGQTILRLYAPECAAHAHPGQFAHIQCAPDLLMRRPLSILRVSKDQGWVEFLYKTIGIGTQRLSVRKPGETLSILGPIGMPFQSSPERPRALLLGGGLGIPPMVFLADRLHQEGLAASAVAFFGSEIPFPFNAYYSSQALPGVSASVRASMPWLEQWQIANRLCSQQDYAGCFKGYVTELADRWLETLTPEEHQQLTVYACGPHAMLNAVARLATKYNLECQLSLEEYMACAVGGCAGCTVEVLTPSGPAMKRVCVDGPVFDLASLRHTVFRDVAANNGA